MCNAIRIYLALRGKTNQKLSYATRRPTGGGGGERGKEGATELDGGGGKPRLGITGVRAGLGGGPGRGGGPFITG